LVDDNIDIREMGKLLCDILEEYIIKTKEANLGVSGFMTTILSVVIIVVLLESIEEIVGGYKGHNS